jgi:hypothetical protein
VRSEIPSACAICVLRDEALRTGLHRGHHDRDRSVCRSEHASNVRVPGADLAQQIEPVAAAQLAVHQHEVERRILIERAQRILTGRHAHCTGIQRPRAQCSDDALPIEWVVIHNEKLRQRAYLLASRNSIPERTIVDVRCVC